LNKLYQSHIEICRILQTLSAENKPVCTDFSDDKFLVSHILSVDPESGHFIIEYSEDKSINSALFESTSLTFKANYQESEIVFKAVNPVDTLFHGEAAIQLQLLDALIVYQQRQHQRIRIRSDVSLRCVVDQAGALPFEARMIDISHDGIGFMSYDANISLPAGTLLRNCKIITPKGEALNVDLVVHHSNTVTRADGTLATRTGVRFIQSPEEIKPLIDIFIREINA
jgi:c-di-GMP-binding flagellar brake protein YcgR